MGSVYPKANLLSQSFVRKWVPETVVQNPLSAMWSHLSCCPHGAVSGSAQRKHKLRPCWGQIYLHLAESPLPFFSLFPSVLTQSFPCISLTWMKHTSGNHAVTGVMVHRSPYPLSITFLYVVCFGFLTTGRKEGWVDRNSLTPYTGPTCLGSQSYIEGSPRTWTQVTCAPSRLVNPPSLRVWVHSDLEASSRRAWCVLDRV